jgi:hypothetical protein
VDVDDARRLLDELGIAERLEHVRRYVWRDGALRFGVDGHVVGYLLAAYWATAGLEVIDEDLQRWTARTTGYVLRVAIDVSVGSSIVVESALLKSRVPFVGRPIEQVAHAVQAELAAYAEAFLESCMPVPQARAEGAERLRSLGLNV